MLGCRRLVAESTLAEATLACGVERHLATQSPPTASAVASHFSTESERASRQQGGPFFGRWLQQRQSYRNSLVQEYVRPQDVSSNFDINRKPIVCNTSLGYHKMNAAARYDFWGVAVSMKGGARTWAGRSDSPDEGSGTPLRWPRLCPVTCE